MRNEQEENNINYLGNALHNKLIGAQEKFGILSQWNKIYAHQTKLHIELINYIKFITKML